MTTSPSVSSSLTRLVLVRGAPSIDLTSEADLARALIRGEKGAEQVAWSRFAPIVRRNLRRLMGPGLDEDDLSQEVFLRFFQRIPSLREPAAVRGFLFGICLRVTCKELRRRRVRRWLRLTDDGSLPEAMANGIAAGDREREAREAVRRYYTILDVIGGQARSLFVTRFVEGVELVDVARLHGLSLSTARRRLARVSKRVEAMLRRDPVLAEVAARRATERDPAASRESDSP